MSEDEQILFKNENGGHNRSTSNLNSDNDENSSQKRLNRSIEKRRASSGSNKSNLELEQEALGEAFAT